jgi:hypothetical protein
MAGDVDEETRTTVFETVVTLFEERQVEEGFADTEVWATSSEIAHRTHLDEQLVVAALRSMDNELLYLREGDDAGDDVEVVGVVTKEQ